MQIAPNIFPLIPHDTLTHTYLLHVAASYENKIYTVGGNMHFAEVYSLSGMSSTHRVLQIVGLKSSI